jgi:hypothetical protein
MCWNDRKGVEGLPLKYVIIILVAALVIGIAIIMATTLGGGIQTSTGILNNTLVNATKNATAGLPGA